MTPPSMAAITASLERSLQSFSLNHHHTTTTAAAGEESTNTHCDSSANSSDATLELNSNMTLPYHWEQCLDLKTGEMYYLNWKTGMKSKEDPRAVGGGLNSYLYSDDYEEEDNDEDESSYADSESSSVESSPAASSSEKQKEDDYKDKDEDKDENEDEDESRAGGHVLVVAGCKGCFMYFMVPKQVGDCPKCCGQLLHF